MSLSHTDNSILLWRHGNVEMSPHIMSAQARIAVIGQSCYAFLDTSSSAPVLFFFNQLEENGEIPHHQFVFWRQNIKSTQEQTCRYNCGFCPVWRTLKLHFFHHLVKLLHSSSTHTHGNILKKYQAFFSHSGHLQIHRAPEAGHRNSILFF